MLELDGLKIGQKEWVARVTEFGKSLRLDFWNDFRAVPESEIRSCEQAIDRVIPDDFREFWRVIGCGHFSGYGGIFSPTELQMISGCDGGIHMCVKDAYRVDGAAVRRLYVTRGAENPAPNIFLPNNLVVDGINLFDLIQIGSNGMCCYHQLVTDPYKYGMGYCLLTDCVEIENRQPDFSAALVSILLDIAESVRGKDEDRD